MNIFPEVNTLFDYFTMGGFVMLPLAIVSVVLWYALIFRALTISFNNQNPRRLLARAEKNKVKSSGVVARVAVFISDLSGKKIPKVQFKSLVDERLLEVKQLLGRYRVLVKSLVAIAPLLGLLGTVDGMIETFDSLGEMALFSASGGIAGGISKALFTTQMGLAVSIPGLLIGTMIERKERAINRELDQIRDLACAKLER